MSTIAPEDLKRIAIRNPFDGVRPDGELTLSTSVDGIVLVANGSGNRSLSTRA